MALVSHPLEVADKNRCDLHASIQGGTVPSVCSYPIELFAMLRMMWSLDRATGREAIARFSKHEHRTSPYHLLYFDGRRSPGFAPSFEVDRRAGS